MSSSQTGIKRYGLPVAVIAVLSIIIVGYAYWLKPPTAVLIIRHAERASKEDKNSPLSVTGQERAQESWVAYSWWWQAVPPRNLGGKVSLCQK